MDALATLFRPVAAMMNRQISLTTPARELCEQLDGRVFAVRVRDTALAAYFLVRADGVSLDSASDQEPDVLLCASLLSLARLAGPNGEELIRDGSVELTGDALLAQQFRRLLSYGRPDVEEELSGLVGDVVAHNIGKAARGFAHWGREVRDTMAQNVGEYLTEERHTVPGRIEVETFRDEVNRLRDDVARFDAKLRKSESAAMEPGS